MRNNEELYFSGDIGSVIALNLVLNICSVTPYETVIMLDEIIIILSTFQPLSIANFALCKKNRGLFMAKFSTTVVLSRQNPVDWRSLWQEFLNSVQILLGLVLSYEAMIIQVSSDFLAHYWAPVVMENSTFYTTFDQ